MQIRYTAGYMSNRSLVERIGSAVQSFHSGDLDAKRLAESLELNGRALEGMPYPLFKELDALIYELEICGFADEEETIADAASVVRKVEQWLHSIPRSV